MAHRIHAVLTLLILGLAGSVVSPPVRAQLMRPHPELLSATASPSLSAAKPGSSFTLRVKFRVGAGAWYYGPKPGGKIVQAQPAAFNPPTDTPFTFGAPKWPKTEIHKDDLGGQTDQHNVYMGTQTLEVPVKVKPNAPKKAYSPTVELTGQVCTPRTCVPLKAPATFKVTVGGADVKNAAALPAIPPGAGTDRGNPGSQGTAIGGATPTGENAIVGEGNNTPPRAFDVTKQVKVDTPKTSWLLVMLFAFLGGLIMNVMPCVLPVVPIKVYTFLEHAQKDHGKAVRLSLAFAAGMLAVFLGLGVVMASVRGLWGAQFQSPVFVTTLGAVMFAMALWLLGVFTIPVPQSVAGVRVSGGDYAGSIGMGALATLLATPCSGPFLGGTLAWAATQPAPLILLTFATVGVGMAFPYVLLVAQPNLLKRLPKPGPWMETWKESMALVMFGVTIYFFSLLPAEAHVPFLLLCLALGAGVWIMHHWGNLTASSAKRSLAGIIALAIVVAGAWNAYKPRPALIGQSPGASEIATANGLEWTPFNVETLNGWLADGRTVVVEWTADWCPNCKYIENTVYRQGTVVDRLKRDVRLMRADITHSFPEAESLLQKLGGQSIPFSVVFRGSDPSHPVVLRDVYTANALLDALDNRTVAAR